MFSVNTQIIFILKLIICSVISSLSSQCRLLVWFLFPLPLFVMIYLSDFSFLPHWCPTNQLWGGGSLGRLLVAFIHVLFFVWMCTHVCILMVPVWLSWEDMFVLNSLHLVPDFQWCALGIDNCGILPLFQCSVITINMGMWVSSSFDPESSSQEKKSNIVVKQKTKRYWHTLKTNL